MEVFRCEDIQPTAPSWTRVCSLELPENDARLHVESFDMGGETVQWFKVRILKGWDDFCSVHRFEGMGRALD